MRAGGPEHAGFICRSWIGGMRGLFPGLDTNWLSAAQHSLIVRMLRTCQVDVLIAVGAQEPDDWFGFACGERERRILHWVYVKDHFRSAGVATRLLEGLFGGDVRNELVEVTTWAKPLEQFTSWQFTKRSYRLCEAIKRSPQG